MMNMTQMKLVNSATKFRHGMDKFYQPNSGLRSSRSLDEAIYTYIYIYIYHIYIYIIYIYIYIYIPYIYIYYHIDISNTYTYYIYIYISSIEIRLQQIGLHLVHPPFSDTLKFSPVRASERNPQALQRYSVCFATDPARFPGVNSIWCVKSLGTPKNGIV